MTTEKPTFLALCIHALEVKIKKKRATVYAMMDPRSKYFDPDFPQRRRSGSRSVFWLEHEVDAWLASRPIVSASTSHEVGE